MIREKILDLPIKCL